MHKTPEIKNSFENEVKSFVTSCQPNLLWVMLASAACYGAFRDDILTQSFCHATFLNYLVVQPALEARQAQNGENPSINLQHAIVMNKLVIKSTTLPLMYGSVEKFFPQYNPRFCTNFVQSIFMTQWFFEAKTHREWVQEQKKLQEQKQDKSI
jgi:hypothetical protein